MSQQPLCFTLFFITVLTLFFITDLTMLNTDEDFQDQHETNRATKKNKNPEKACGKLTDTRRTAAIMSSS